MQETRHPHDIPKPHARGCGGIFFVLMLLIASMIGAGLGVFLWVLEDARGTIAALESFRPKAGTKVYSFDGELLGEFAIEERQIVPLNEIPLNVQKAFVATEDDKFYTHVGVRPDAILNAALYIFKTGRTRGGSTITQQVVRNVEPLGVGLERNVYRKLREAIVALQVEREFTKDEILELYLNQIFLGISAYGVEAASRQYFGKSCSDLTLGEAAALAGLTRGPNSNEPLHHLKNTKTRRDIVLGQMLENGFISQTERDAALQEDLDASVITPEERAAARHEGKGLWATRQFKAPYFCEEVRRFALDQYETAEVFEGGLEIQTTLDMRLQRYAEDALLKALDTFDEKRKTALEKAGKGEEYTPVDGALVCLDNRAPWQGFVRAMVGGRDFEKEKYNTATQARRQPGSSVKPFVWAAAIASGMTPSSIVVDEPFERLDGAGNVWRPKNFDAGYHGPMTIRAALEKSVNIVSIKLAEQVGVPLVRSYMQRCGITTPIDDAVGLTIALGTPEVKVIDQCVAYSTFANNGVRYDPVMVTEIKNRDGITRYDYRNNVHREQAIDPKVAYVINHLLQGVCTPGGGYYPTGHRASALGRPVGGKTGTTNSSRNTWFCGFTADYTCIVWLGYRDNRSLGKGADYTGGRLACPIWTEFMLNAEEGLPVRDFDVPNGIEFFNIDRIQGTLGGNYKEAYIKGTRPPDTWYSEGQTVMDESEEEMLVDL